jgi:YebC/PmpR family DNA-binding regulatory protein
VSSLVQLTVCPTFAFTVAGLNARPFIDTCRDWPPEALAPPDALVLVVLLLLGAALEVADELELELEPHPARASAISASTGSRSRLINLSLPGAPLNWKEMSGHSKWHSIKHKKAVVDARRGQQFTKLARAVTVAAREGGGDPDGNPSLALAIQKARDASMPKDNIERAIAKGTGEGLDADNIETVLYEGYGPGGVALLIEALTDNRNRTGADIRHAFNKHGGNLGEPGSVAYLFDKRGVIVVDATNYDEDDLIPAIDAGAEDIARDEDVFEVITEPASLPAVRDALAAAGVELDSADVTQRPKTRVPVDEGDASKLMKLIDALEDSDDVGAVHANFDVDAAVLERIAS